MSRNHCRCRGKCRCQRRNQVVHPTQEDVQHSYSEETVQHVHPYHTTVINHHTIRNEHFYPYTRSYENRVNEVDVRGVSEGDGDVRGVGEERSPYGYRGNQGFGAMSCGCRGHCRCRRRRRRGWW